MLTTEEVKTFFELIQQFHTLLSDASPGLGMISDYCNDSHWWQQGYCMRLGLMDHITEEAATAKALGFDLKMFPVTGAEGKLTAEIDWLGAVIANCPYPEVAYEFLRMFLLPEAMTNWPIWDGQPIRTYGYVSAVYRNYYEDAMRNISKTDAKNVLADADERQERLDALKKVEITDADLPILQNTIDVAQITPWELKAELSSMIKQLNDPATGEPTEVDIEALAEGYIDFLNTYLHGQMGGE